MATATITETTAGSSNQNKTQVDLPERLTVRHLIRLYIDHQVAQQRQKESRQKVTTFFLPSEVELQLNQSSPREFAPPPPKQFDLPKLYDRAWNAFSSNQFVLLVDEEQVDDLDDEVAVEPNTDVKFLKLTPLVGG